jgi:hypothetical protein
LVPNTFDTESNGFAHYFTAYKQVDKKIKPASTTFPDEACIKCQIPFNPLKTLTPLSKHPLKFTPTPHINQQCLNTLNINSDKFLFKEEEEKLFIQVMMNNEQSLTFVDTERGTLKESYFPPYVIPTIPPILWKYENIPISLGIQEKVIEVLKNKMAVGIYEPSQSSYRS